MSYEQSRDRYYFLRYGLHSLAGSDKNSALFHDFAIHLMKSSNHKGLTLYILEPVHNFQHFFATLKNVELHR